MYMNMCNFCFFRNFKKI